MKNELKRRRILKALQSECAALGALTTKLENNLGSKRTKNAA